MSFGQNVQFLRRMRNRMTQEALAEKLPTPWASTPADLPRSRQIPCKPAAFAPSGCIPDKNEPYPQ